MGRRQGLPLRRLGFRPPPPTEPRLRFARACAERVEDHAPELAEETRALAEASGADPEAMASLVLTACVPPEALPRCTVVAVMPERASGGGVLVGRNYDYFHDVSREGATVFGTRPDEGYAHAGCCDIWVGREDGLNDAGLYLAVASLMLPGVRPGLAFWLAARLVLDRCSTVGEGLALLRSVPHAAGMGFLLADASGAAAVAEASLEGVEARGPKDGLLVLTNHALTSRLAGRESHVPATSQERYRRVRELLGCEGSLGSVELRRALSDHEGTVCAHRLDEEPGRRFGTLWSEVVRPAEGILEVAEGAPCRARYRLARP
jgi:hypothetical protein